MKRISRALICSLLFLFALPVFADSKFGTISAINSTPTAACSANSCVTVTMQNKGALTVTIPSTAVYTASGGLSAQVSGADGGVLWFTMLSSTTFTKLNCASSCTSATIPSGATGIYQVNEAAGVNGFRLTALGSVTGSAPVYIETSLVSGGGTATITGGGGGGTSDASAANQITQINTLTSIDGKTPALGQAVAANSTPVVLTAAQVTTLTPPAAISGFATAVKQPALGSAGTPAGDVITVQGITGGTALKTDSSATTQPVSASSLPLPSGASTAAKQPALGTAGSPAADVITVQGITSGTALKTDSSATTQPISAASLPLPSLAATSTKQSDGSQKSQIVDGSGNVIGSTANAIDVNIKSGSSSGAVAQGSTTSGQTGGLTQAAVTTSPPTYTTGQTSPITMTTGGGVRVAAASGSIASGAVASGAYAAGALASGSVASGAVVDLGAQADAVCGSDTGTCGLIPLIKKANVNLTALAGTNTDLTAVQTPVAPAAATATKGNLSAGQYNSTPPTFSSGQQGSIQLDASGNTKVAIVSNAATGLVAQGSTTSGQTGNLILCAVTTGSPTYTTGQTSPCSVDTSGQMRITGTVSAGGVAQGSTTSGQTGNLIQGAVTTSPPSYTTAQTSPISITPAGGVRVDGSNVTQPISAASLPLPTGAANAIAQGATTSGQTGTLAQMSITTTPPAYTTAQTSPLSGDVNGFLRVIEPDDKAIAAVTCSSVCTGVNLFAVNTVGYNSVRVQVSALGSGTLGFQTSEDTTNGTDGTWVTASCASSNSAAGTGGATSAGGVASWVCPTYAKWLRLNIFTYSAGTFTTLGGRLSKALPSNVQVTLGNSSISVIGAASDNAAPVLAPLAVAFQAQSYNTKRSAITSGNVGRPTIDPNGYVNITHRNSFAHMATATTTTHKSGAGILHSVCVNTKGTGTSTVTIYDNTAGSGTVVAIIDSANLSGCFQYNLEFGTGLTAVTAGTTAPDVTFSYN